jgi:hypothetical protein
LGHLAENHGEVVLQLADRCGVTLGWCHEGEGREPRRKLDVACTGQSHGEPSQVAPSAKTREAT